MRCYQYLRDGLDHAAGCTGSHAKPLPRFIEGLGICRVKTRCSVDIEDGGTNSLAVVVCYEDEMK